MHVLSHVNKTCLDGLAFAIAWHILPVPGCVPCWNNPGPLPWIPGVMLKLCCLSQLSGNHWLLAWHWACPACPAWVPWGRMQHQLWLGWSELAQHQGFLSFPLCPTAGRLWADQKMGEQMCRSHYGPPNSEDNGLSIDVSVVTSKTHIKVIEISSIQYPVPCWDL